MPVNDIHDFLGVISYFLFITSQTQKDFIISASVWSISFSIALQYNSSSESKFDLGED